MSLVLVDTCIWAPFFQRPHSSERRALDALLDEDRAALIGPIVAEVLQGFPREAQANYIESLLAGMRFIETRWEDWAEAARLSRRLAENGKRVPLTDLVLAAVALRVEAEIFTIDPHFDLVPELKRFSPQP